MANKYLSFISDAHLLSCISNLHDSYVKAQKKLTKSDFYTNKVDVIKLTFDAKFQGLTAENVITSEILRQIDKSVNNSIGTFHEQILGGISGYQSARASGYDIKASDNTLFADIKNKHNTMNSSAAESLYRKLKEFADRHKQAKCYWVQIFAKNSFDELWVGEINGKEYRHSRVYKISGDKFYAKLTGLDDAFFQLYKILPTATDDYLKSKGITSPKTEISAIKEITDLASANSRTILDQIAIENYGYYFKFKDL